MGYDCKILLDSVSETGKRLTTFELTYPRLIHSEFMTHRMFSRNTASSRAIPFKTIVQKVLDDPFIPEKFPINGKGMQPQEYYEPQSKYPGIPTREYKAAKRFWLEARDSAIKTARGLVGEYNAANTWWDERDQKLYGGDTFYLNVHKQIANRLLEPFMWHTAICTATEFDNFFKLRTDENAQYEIRRIADLMYSAYHAFDNPEVTSKIFYHHLDYEGVCDIFSDGWSAIRPQKLKVGEWHCPLVSVEDEELILEYINNENCHLKPTLYESDRHLVLEFKKKISVARCARVSYLTHDGVRSIEKDLELFERLKTSGHWSPFEHVAQPHFDMGLNLRSGNFIGWKQYRKEFQDENCTNFRKE